MTNVNDTSSTATVEEATVALANLGVTGAIDICLQHDPAVVLGWCAWAEERRRNNQPVGTGLLVSSIRRGGPPPQPGVATARASAERRHAEFRQRFRAKVLPFPPGSVCETHAAAERRRRQSRAMAALDDIFPEDRDPSELPPVEIDLCDGELIVTDRSGMVLAAQCDTCGEQIGYPLRAITLLPDRPLAVGREIPGSPSPSRREWTAGDPDGLRRLDPMASVRGVVVEQHEQEAA